MVHLGHDHIASRAGLTDKLEVPTSLIHLELAHFRDAICCLADLGWLVDERVTLAHRAEENGAVLGPQCLEALSDSLLEELRSKRLECLLVKVSLALMGLFFGLFWLDFELGLNDAKWVICVQSERRLLSRYE